MVATIHCQNNTSFDRTLHAVGRDHASRNSSGEWPSLKTRFAAFLRGVNVGGHNVVTKGRLQEVFVSLGFENVVTYRQSGNVIFEGAEMNTEEVRVKVEAKLRKAFGYDLAVLVRTVAALKLIVEQAPFRHEDTKGTSFLVTFLPIPLSKLPHVQLPLVIPKSSAKVVSAKGAEVFSVTHGGGEGGLPNPFWNQR